MDQNGHLGGGDRHEHVDDQRYGGEPSEQPEDDEQSARDLDDADEGTKHLREGNSNFYEPPDAQFVWGDEFENPFQQEHETGDTSDEEQGRGASIGSAQDSVEQLIHCFSLFEG